MELLLCGINIHGGRFIESVSQWKSPGGCPRVLAHHEKHQEIEQTQFDGFYVGAALKVLTVFPIGLNI
jgi:hypothetical protein